MAMNGVLSLITLLLAAIPIEDQRKVEEVRRIEDPLPELDLSESNYYMEEESDFSPEAPKEEKNSFNRTVSPYNAPARTQENRNKLTVNIFFEPIERTTLSAQISAAITKITKRMGESFKQGDVLIELNPSNFKAKLEKARGTFERALYQRSVKEQLFQERIASQFEFRAAEADFIVAKSELDLAVEDLNHSIIKAPYNGKVVSLLVQEHEFVQVAQPLIQIINDEVLIGKVLLPSSWLKDVFIGKSFRVNVRDTGEEVVARVIRIDAVIDPSSSMFKVDVAVDNKKGHLKAGMNGILIVEKEEEFFTPDHAIRREFIRTDDRQTSFAPTDHFRN